MTNKALEFSLSHLPIGMVLAVCAIALTGCGTFHSARMWFPKASGMDEVDPQLYVEPVMSSKQRHEVQQQINIGRAVVEAFYGEITTKPYFVVCLTTECNDRFGSYGQPAASYGDLAIRLSFKELARPVVAHEWSHAELYRRAGGWWYARKIPRWFDEGVAVVVANEPLHSEANWREIERQALPIPKLDELISFSDWGVAVKRYGETAGDVPGNLHVVYTTAGHAVRAFLSCTGPSGVAAVLGAVRSGAAFNDAFAKVTAKCVH